MEKKDKMVILMNILLSFIIFNENDDGNKNLFLCFM